MTDVYTVVAWTFFLERLAAGAGQQETGAALQENNRGTISSEPNNDYGKKTFP